MTMKRLLLNGVSSTREKELREGNAYDNPKSLQLEILEIDQHTDEEHAENFENKVNA